MDALPQTYSQVRSPRLRLPRITRAILRFWDGYRLCADLIVVSLTGGLLRVAHPVRRGSRVRLLFLTRTGPVLGDAELLRPLSWTEQPFRFTFLSGPDQRRLLADLPPGSFPTNLFQEYEGIAGIPEYNVTTGFSSRSLSTHALAFRAVAATLGLGGLLYLFLHLK